MSTQGDVKELPSLEELKQGDVKELPSLEDLGHVSASDKWLEGVKERASMIPGMAQSAGISAAKQIPIVGGYLPQINAGLEKISDPVLRYLGEKQGIGPYGDLKKLNEQGFNVVQPDVDYTKVRDKYSKQLDKVEEDNPWSSRLGGAAGFAAGAALPLGAIAKEATLGQKALQGAKFGALFGALSNPGDKEGEFDPIQLKERALGVSIGAGVGASIPVAAEKAITPAATKVGNWLSNKAEKFAMSGLGLPTMAEMESMLPSGEYQKIGREILDNDAISAGESKGEKFKKLLDIINNKTDDVDELVKKYSKLANDPNFLANLSPEEMSQLNASKFKPLLESKKLQKEFINKYGRENIESIQKPLKDLSKYGNKYGFETLEDAMDSIPDIEGKIKQLASQGLDDEEIQHVILKTGKKLLKEGTPITLAETQAQKRRINNLVKDSVYSKIPMERTLRDQALINRQQSLKQSVEDQANLIAELSGNSGDIGKIKDTNKSISRLIKARDLAQDAWAREEKNRSLGLKDSVLATGGGTIGALAGGLMAGPSGVAAGGAIGGAIGYGGSVLQKKYGADLAALASDKASKTLLQMPRFAQMAETNPLGFQMLVSKMSQRLGEGKTNLNNTPITDQEAKEAFKNSD